MPQLPVIFVMDMALLCGIAVIFTSGNYLHCIFILQLQRVAGINGARYAYFCSLYRSSVFQ
ncbi:hypothetical protein RABR111495_07985 [Rahnella bruchi]